MTNKKFSDHSIMFTNRILKKRKHLKKWLSRERINAYRIYDADIPEYALAVDVYITNEQTTHLVVYEYQAPSTVDPEKAKLRLKEALLILQREFTIPPQQLYLKVRKKQKGTAQYEKLENKNQTHTVTEFGSRFLVNFNDYLDTGLFIDHRSMRKLIFDYSENKSFLNLFAYTGSVTVYAARGGATNTTTLDMSNTYLEIAKSNMALNGFTQSQHMYLQEDCLHWLKKQKILATNSTAYQKYDLIFLDPPAFSTSKRMKESFDVLRDHAVIIEQSMSILSPTGVLVFSNNNRRFRIDNKLFEQYRIVNISKKTIPKDFESNPKIHNSWEIQHIQNK